MFKLAKFLSILVVLMSVVVFSGTIFLGGYHTGYILGKHEQLNQDEQIISKVVSATTEPSSSSPPKTVTNTKIVYVTPPPVPKWGGPDLWAAVNKRRVEFGVNPLQVKDEICTIASIRLNQMLALGTLDGHKGFTSMPTDRPDLKPTFDKYNLSEFLVSGASSAQNAVDLWENTLGHKELLTGGQYVWGCIYAQNGFGVAIAAY